MLRNNVEYAGKRTNDLLKVKNFEREEYTVVELEMGNISNNGGKYSGQKGLKSVTIMHKDCPVDVGSGFSDKERLHYFKNPHDILNKIISVQFFEETTTKVKGKTNYSLRFPTFKGVYGESRDF